jgi:hypothetical protein
MMIEQVPALVFFTVLAWIAIYVIYGVLTMGTRN